MYGTDVNVVEKPGRKSNCSNLMKNDKGLIISNKAGNKT